MKKNVNRFLILLKCFRKYQVISTIAFLLLSLTYFQGNAQSQNVLDKVLTLRLQKVSLREMLNKISENGNCQFIYSKDLLPLENKVSVNAENKKLSSILEELLKPYHVIYKATDSYIFIKEDPRKANQPAKTVMGQVIDASTKQAMVGVNIGVKGTAQGTSSNASGKYTITTNDEKAVLVFSFVGYGSKEIAVGNQSVINVDLSPSTEALQEVVVIGYGKQSKSKITGSISQVKSQELNRYASSSFANQLAGKAAGVVINEASAQPGADPQIVIRGIGTLTAGRSPLVVVDGFPLSEGSSLNSINPQDIETIDVLKDPASAAIYGSRAANGVILITTKKGKEDRLTISLDAYTGIQQRADNVQYVDAYEAAQYFTEARDWGYVSKDPANRSINDDRATRIAKGASLRELRLNYLQPYLDKQPGLTNTNWLNEIFRTAPIRSYNLALTRGTSKSSYFVSFNYLDQQGIVIENGLNRYSGTIKIDSKLSDKIDFSVAVNPSFSTQNYFENDANWSNDPVAGVLIMYPFFSPYNADGSLSISKQIIANTPEDGALGENAVALIKKIKNTRNLFRTFGNTYLSYEPVPGLKFKALVGADIRNNYFDFYNPSDVGGYRTAAPKPASAVETRELNVNYLVENTVNYNTNIGLHNIDALVGYTFQKETGSSTKVTGSGIPDDNIPNIGGASAFSATASRYVWSQVSFLARLQYAFQNKYLLSGTIRRDGSSRFGDQTKWGNFPSVTAGWIVSNEDFFPKTKVVSFAKLRATYGQSGNNQIGSYSSKALVGPSNYVYGNTLGPGFSATSTPNPNLSWETKTSMNLGLNLGLWNKFNLTADYYNSTTQDLLLDVPIPEQSGFTSSIQNIGKVRNSGFELELGSNAIDLGAVKWSFNANIATNSNKVLELAPGQQQIIAGTDGNFVTRVGGSIAELSGYNVTGVYKNQDDINKTPHLTGTVVGDYIVEDLNNDGVIDQKDQKIFGTYNPNFTYGFGSTFFYKNFELSFSFNGIEGRKIYDRAASSQDESGEGFGVPNKYYFDNRYHPVDNPNGFLAQPNMGNFSSARKLTRSSNLFYKDADYLRLRTLQLSYNIPQQVLSKLKITNARVYVTANNLLTITKYRGFNPDATSPDNILTNGYSYTNYPVARSFILGLSLTF